MSTCQKRGENSTERVNKYLHVQGSEKHIDRKLEGNRNNNSKQVTQMRRIDTKVGYSGRVNNYGDIGEKAVRRDHPTSAHRRRWVKLLTYS